jgi:omega-6 fatty acid desaturase (delta-12 desaturase)
MKILHKSSANVKAARLHQAGAREIVSAFREKNNSLAIGVIGIDFAVYALSVFFGAMSHAILAKLIFGIICGVFSTRLFVLAHDACHQSLTSIRSLNRWLGKISFLPSLTPYSSWELAHNATHHVFSNWSQRDYVWTPFSKTEFDALPAWRRGLERIYRSPFGHGLYYLAEIWWKRLYFPKKRYIAVCRMEYRFDSIGISIFFALRVVFLILMAKLAGRGMFLQLLTMEVIPFAVWNSLMGFTIFLHHTHPRVPWFLNRDEWTENEAQLQSTVHVQFSVPFDSIFYNIYKHTAHHLDVGIPFYHLPEAQRKIEAAYPDNIIVERLTFKRFLAATHACKLYDYGTHCWLDFKGRVTARTRLGELR